MKTIQLVPRLETIVDDDFPVKYEYYAAWDAKGQNWHAVRDVVKNGKTVRQFLANDVVDYYHKKNLKDKGYLKG
jgi:hypothetical protein